jgi:hypothetical protein
MSPKHDAAGMILAPGASANTSTYGFPGHDRSPTPVTQGPTNSPSPFPRVDVHVVKPEVTREIMIRGERMVAQPAKAEHADAHAQLDFVLLPHVKDKLISSSDLLTHVTHGSDFATDASIRKVGTDPATGGRYLEELSFEIINEQSDSKARAKVEDLAFRGVRRIFAIFAKKREVCEWSKTTNEFVKLDIDGFIEDPTLIRPISVRALLDRTYAEIDVAKALIKKNNPEIAKLKQQVLDEGHKKGLDEGHKKGLDEGHKKGLDEGHKKGLDEGELRGRRAMLRELLAAQFGELPPSVVERIETANIDHLRGWMKCLRHATSLDEVFVE